MQKMKGVENKAMKPKGETKKAAPASWSPRESVSRTKLEPTTDHCKERGH